MAKQVEVHSVAYQCERTGQKFSTMSEAEASERRYDIAMVEEEFRSIFPLEHDKDTELDKHCVACGKKLLPILSVFSGIGPTWFKEAVSSHNKAYYAATILFGGAWCQDCCDDMKKILVRVFRPDSKK